MKKEHLVILKRPYLRLIISGQKTIECRLTKGRCIPFNNISNGDKLYLKLSSGPVVATANVESFFQAQDLSLDQLALIKDCFNPMIMGSEEYWYEKADSQFCILIWLTNVKEIQPIQIKKKDWRAWVVLSAKNDFGLLLPTKK